MSKQKKIVVENTEELINNKGIKEELVQAATEALNEVAAKQGKTAAQLQADLKAEEHSKSNWALTTVDQLTHMIVDKYQQTIILNSSLETFYDSFEKHTPQGNGVEFLKHVPTAPNIYQPAKFIPDDFTGYKFRKQIIKFKEDDDSLAPDAYQDRYLVVWTQTELFTKFINGQYLEFIQNDIISKIDKPFILVMYHRLMEFIIKKVKAGKTINGTAANMFSAITEEVIPTISKFKLNTNEFNLDQTLTEIYDASQKEDIILMCNSKVASMLKSNIMSQLFNSSNIDLHNWVGQVHIVNNKIALTPDQPIQHLAVPYLDDNEIIVFDKKNFVKILQMLDMSGAQDFPLNIASMRVFHYWYVMGALDWGKAFYYNNANLTTSPTP